MGAVLGILGLGGGSGGSNAPAPTTAAIQNPLANSYIQPSIQGNNTALNSQQQLLSAIQGQNGLGNQSSVYNQLQGITNGTGPNPAQAMLNQSTGQNVANQAALAAGQRGAASNVGLISRQAAQQGSNAQQQAAGQGATLQANQSLNALGQQAGIANTQAGQQIGATTANTQAQQAQEGQLLNSLGTYNGQLQQGQASVNAANAGVAASQAGQQSNAVGSVANGITGGLGALTGFAQGGVAQQGPKSSLGQMLAGYAKGGTVNLVGGGNVKASSPSQKAVKKGNSYANDKIPAMLSEGEIVIPRDVLQSSDPVRGSADFVRATLAKKRGK